MSQSSYDVSTIEKAAASVGLSSSGLAAQYRDFPRGQVSSSNLNGDGHLPLLGGALPDADSCTWTADTKPEYYVAFYMQDNWSPEGYLGQVQGKKSHPVPPHSRTNVRYHFTYAEGTSGSGSTGGTGGNP